MRGSVVKRGKSYSIVVDMGRGPDGRRRQKWIATSAERKKDAEARMAEVLAELNRGLEPVQSKETVSQFMGRWLRDHVAHTTRPRTVAFYAQVNRLYIEPTIGHVELRRLRPADVQHMLAYVLGKGLSPTTARRAYATLHAALERALKWGVVHRNVADAIDAPREAESGVNAPDGATVRALLEKAAETPHGAAFWVLAHTGMRRGEVCAVRREHLDLERGLLSVVGAVGRVNGKLTVSPPKSGASRRMLHLGESTVAVLRAHLARQAEQRLALGSLYRDDGFLFAPPGGGWLDPDLLTQTWQRLCRGMGVHYRLHDLRHHHATALIENGVHIAAVQARLGHSSPSLTMRVYAHVTPRMDREAADIYDRAMAG